MQGHDGRLDGPEENLVRMLKRDRKKVEDHLRLERNRSLTTLECLDYGWADGRRFLVRPCFCAVMNPGSPIFPMRSVIFL